MTQDEVVAWHHQLDGHEFEQKLQELVMDRSLVCCFSIWFVSLFYFICNAPISFSLCSPISPSLLFFMFFLKPLSSIVKIFCIHIYKYIQMQNIYKRKFMNFF